MTSEQKGLRLAAGVTMLTGLALALAAVPALNLPMRLLADILIWPLDQAQTIALPETRLAFAIAGGVLTAWGLMIWHLAGELLQSAPKPVRAIIRTSVLCWFVVDSAGSVAAGAALNILPNLVFLALFLVPMRGARATFAA
ncbi:hypothetical protein [Tabrizicola sp.]|uniref:hypothetical protein n=1 Tax=Tabrizicola sp. TaxID=2005166 RepID=UPI002735AC13|nr:hypothetical protein [Tabrizicola sp.]MDP3196551.1 hypothetical protein [Tabrizicola sp.]